MHRRQSKTYWLEVFGVVGGLVALISGFSILHLIEFAYWITIRWWETNRSNNEGQLYTKEDLEFSRASSSTSKIAWVADDDQEISGWKDGLGGIHNNNNKNQEN